MSKMISVFDMWKKSATHVIAIAIFASAFVTTSFTSAAFAANGSKAQVKKSKTVRHKNTNAKPARQKNAMGANLQTEHTFNPLSVRGKYLSAFETNTVTDNEKSLSELIDYRTNYADRLQRMQEQN